MSGYRSNDMRHDCRRHGCLQELAPNLEWMRGCFPRGIMPSDIDGFVELNGHVLFIEQKRAGGCLSGGQARAIRRLAQLPDAAVLLIRETDDPDVYECIYRDGETSPSGWQRYTVQQLQTWLSTWARAAEQVPA